MKNVNIFLFNNNIEFINAYKNKSSFYDISINIKQQYIIIKINTFYI